MRDLVYKTSASGRVCLVGEHCDYAQGMSVALPTSERITLYGERRTDNKVSLTTGLEGKLYEIEFSLDAISLPQENPLRYSVAVIQLLSEAYPFIQGMDITVKSNLPAKKGLASSASVSVATANLYNKAYELGISADAIAELAYHAEHDLIGVGCGRMDQLVAVHETPIAIDYRHAGKPRVTKINPPQHPFYFLVGVPLATKRALHIMLEEANRAYAHPQNLNDHNFRNALDDIIPNTVVKPFIEAVQTANLPAAGELLRRNQQIYNEYFIPISESFDAPLLNQFLTIAKENGSLGEKWTGAGGAGAFICLTDSPDRRTMLKKTLERKAPVDLHFVEVNL